MSKIDLAQMKDRGKPQSSSVNIPIPRDFMFPIQDEHPCFAWNIESDNDLSQYQVHLQDGEIDLKLGLLQSAIAKFDWVLNKVSFIKKKISTQKLFVQVLTILNNDALRLLNSNEIDKATIILDRCNAWTKNLSSDPLMRALTLCNIGLSLRKRNKISTSLDYFSEALGILLANNIKCYLGIVYINLAIILSSIGGHAKALEFAQKALIETQTTVSADLTISDNSTQESSQKSENKNIYESGITNLILSYHILAKEEEFFLNLEDALRHYETAVTVSQKNLGSSNPLTLTCMQEFSKFSTRYSNRIAMQQSSNIVSKKQSISSPYTPQRVQSAKISSLSSQVYFRKPFHSFKPSVTPLNNRPLTPRYNNSQRKIISARNSPSRAISSKSALPMQFFTPNQSGTQQTQLNPNEADRQLTPQEPLLPSSEEQRETTLLLGQTQNSSPFPTEILLTPTDHYPHSAQQTPKNHQNNQNDFSKNSNSSLLKFQPYSSQPRKKLLKRVSSSSKSSGQLTIQELKQHDQLFDLKMKYNKAFLKMKDIEYQINSQVAHNNSPSILGNNTIFGNSQLNSNFFNKSSTPSNTMNSNSYFSRNTNSQLQSKSQSTQFLRKITPSRNLSFQKFQQQQPSQNNPQIIIENERFNVKETHNEPLLIDEILDVQIANKAENNKSSSGIIKLYLNNSKMTLCILFQSLDLVFQPQHILNVSDIFVQPSFNSDEVKSILKAICLELLPSLVIDSNSLTFNSLQNSPSQKLKLTSRGHEFILLPKNISHSIVYTQESSVISSVNQIIDGEHQFLDLDTTDQGQSSMMQRKSLGASASQIKQNSDTSKGSAVRLQTDNEKSQNNISNISSPKDDKIPSAKKNNYVNQNQQQQQQQYFISEKQLVFSSANTQPQQKQAQVQLDVRTIYSKIQSTPNNNTETQSKIQQLILFNSQNKSNNNNGSLLRNKEKSAPFLVRRVSSDKVSLAQNNNNQQNVIQQQQQNSNKPTDFSQVKTKKVLELDAYVVSQNKTPNNNNNFQMNIQNDKVKSHRESDKRNQQQQTNNQQKQLDIRDQLKQVEKNDIQKQELKIQQKQFIGSCLNEAELKAGLKIYRAYKSRQFRQIITWTIISKKLQKKIIKKVLRKSFKALVSNLAARKKAILLIVRWLRRKHFIRIVNDLKFKRALEEKQKKNQEQQEIAKKASQTILKCIRKIKFYRTVQQAIKLKRAGRIVLHAYLRWKFRKQIILAVKQRKAARMIWRAYQRKKFIKTVKKAQFVKQFSEKDIERIRKIQKAFRQRRFIKTVNLAIKQRKAARIVWKAWQRKKLKKVIQSARFVGQFSKSDVERIVKIQRKFRRMRFKKTVQLAVLQRKAARRIWRVWQRKKLIKVIKQAKIASEYSVQDLARIVKIQKAFRLRRFRRNVQLAIDTKKAARKIWKAWQRKKLIKVIKQAKIASEYSVQDLARIVKIQKAFRLRRFRRNVQLAINTKKAARKIWRVWQRKKLIKVIKQAKIASEYSVQDLARIVKIQKAFRLRRFRRNVQLAIDTKKAARKIWKAWQRKKLIKVVNKARFISEFSENQVKLIIKIQRNFRRKRFAKLVNLAVIQRKAARRIVRCWRRKKFKKIIDKASFVAKFSSKDIEKVIKIQRKFRVRRFRKIVNLAIAQRKAARRIWKVWKLKKFKKVVLQARLKQQFTDKDIERIVKIQKAFRQRRFKKTVNEAVKLRKAARMIWRVWQRKKLIKLVKKVQFVSNFSEKDVQMIIKIQRAFQRRRFKRIVTQALQERKAARKIWKVWQKKKFLKVVKAINFASKFSSEDIKRIIKIQKAFRIRRFKRTVILAIKQRKAARKIWKVWQRKKLLKVVKQAQIVSKFSSKDIEQIVKVQRAFRKRKFRNTINLAIQMKKVASKIQSAFRRRKFIKCINAKIQQKKRIQEHLDCISPEIRNAATVIVKALRRKLLIKVIKTQILLKKCVKKIQRAYRRRKFKQVIFKLIEEKKKVQNEMVTSFLANIYSTIKTVTDIQC